MVGSRTGRMRGWGGGVVGAGRACVGLLVLLLFVFGAALPHGAAAQASGLESICAREEVGLLGAEESCLATAQAAETAQPLLGILIAGGNPTIGSAGAAGLRLGILPRVSAGARLNVVAVRIPDILAAELPGEVATLSRLGVPAPALAVDLSVGLFDGIQLAPGLGGIGGVSVLGSIGILPFQLFDAEGFERAEAPYGIGARLHLLEESFIAPGVSLSVVRRSLPEIAFGDICPGGLVRGDIGQPEGQEVGGCAGAGDLGEFAFDLTSWSTRLVASKRLLGLGAAVGVGHDSHDSTLGFGFRGDEPVPGSDLTPAFRASGIELENARWTLFGNLSFTLLVASLGLEAGWVQGDAPISGFRDLETDFDPRDGTWYASLGGRISL